MSILPPGTDKTQPPAIEHAEVLCACGHTYTSHAPGECIGCTGPACDGTWRVLRVPLSKGKAELSFVPHLGHDTATFDVAEGPQGQQRFTCNNITRADALRLYLALGDWLVATRPAARGVSE